MLNFAMLDRFTIQELVYEEIRNRILMGDIAPGERIREIKLAEEFDVSRTPVREAIRALETEGLVKLVPRKGAYAYKVTIEEMDEIIEIRQDIEGIAAYYAAQRSTSRKKKLMQAASEKYKQAVNDKDALAMMKWNNEFHRILIESSGNKVLIQLAEQLQERITPAQYRECCMKRAYETSEEHACLVEAIKRGDCVSAQRIASNHIKRLRPQDSN